MWVAGPGALLVAKTHKIVESMIALVADLDGAMS